MPRFSRILTRREADAIRANNRVPTNYSECPPYRRGDVVFLFTEAAEADAARYRSACEALATDAYGDPVEAYRLTIEAELPVEIDRSGWGSIGGVVHRGEIDLTGTVWSLTRYPWVAAR